MDPASLYKSLDEPDRADHLWRYTPWKRVHPSGDLSEIPATTTPKLTLSCLDENVALVGISIEEGIVGAEVLPESDEVTSSFIRAAAGGSIYTLRTENNFIASAPIILDIDTGDSPCALHLALDIGRHCEFELITQISGASPWTGVLRSGRIGDGSILNDVVIGHTDSGTLLRVDSIAIGRDAQVKAGTVSSGSERTKADLRYKMGETGGHLNVLGSILSASDMHLDHHVEIHHDAPETFSRLDWHSACGGNSRTVGTGMLRVAKGARGADAGQLFHNLLLSEKAEADSIPELEVSEHDVVGCGHGTANGPVDEEQMFYLESRGFNTTEARDSLIAAFLNSTLVEMGSDTLHHWLAKHLQDELDDLNT
ncbi:MAG: SufD family Fe-S cluster assembly protein [Candidatus Thalassarchaeaceae archaeon]|nr:SufD family Fe-S cluster assembly protein [Candidatus Thalassarchaeaceae archaeon]